MMKPGTMRICDHRLTAERFNMKLIVLVALVFVCKVFGQCPARENLDCPLYETGGETGEGNCDRYNTYFIVGDLTCIGCNIYIPEIENGCPSIKCPYKKDISEILRQDCGVEIYQMKVDLGSIGTCDACKIAAYNCTGSTEVA